MLMLEHLKQLSLIDESWLSRRSLNSQQLVDRSSPFGEDGDERPLDALSDLVVGLRGSGRGGTGGRRHQQVTGFSQQCWAWGWRSRGLQPRLLLRNDVRGFSDYQGSCIVEPGHWGGGWRRRWGGPRLFWSGGHRGGLWLSRLLFPGQSCVYSRILFFSGVSGGRGHLSDRMKIWSCICRVVSQRLGRWCGHSGALWLFSVTFSCWKKNSVKLIQY